MSFEPYASQGPTAEDTENPGSSGSFPANESSNETAPDPVANSQVQEDPNALEQMRSKWRQLLSTTPIEGDAWYVIPKSFLDRVKTLDVASIGQLVANLGPLDSSVVVNENGALYAEGSEPEPSVYIHADLFHDLVNTFGSQGTPVVRNIIHDTEKGLALERFPPYFIVHTLTDSANARVPSYHDRSLRTSQSFSLSQTKTFRDLVVTINNCLYKGRKQGLRVWFVSCENIADLPHVVPISMFVNDISETKVVEPRVMDLSLQSQGICSSTIHLVVELQDKHTEDYPLDQYIARQESRAGQVSHFGGDLGLSNLGNTCYMNSALQCLVHIPEVNQYFLYDLFKQELNKENPLGNNGEVASSFSMLIHKLFDSKGGTSVTPREFKYTIGRYSSMFYGFQQQDTQEFLSWLLDALHEDLNRIHKKPYTEKPELKDEDVGNMKAIAQLASDCWDLYKQRNDSIIVDLFTGLYQSTLVCPACDKQSITFDPFNDFTLPLPVSKKWYHTFTIVDMSVKPRSPQIYQLEVELSKTSNIDDLKDYLSNFLGVESANLFLFEIFRNFFYKDFQTGASVNKFIPVSELISDDDNVVVYIIPHDPSQDMIIPVVNVVQDADDSYSIKEPFGLPLFVVCDRKKSIYSFGLIRSKVEEAVKLLSNESIEEKYLDNRKTGDSKFYSSYDFPLLKKTARDDKMEDCTSDEDLEGYDSDISLAHPSRSASLGFEMMLYEDSQREQQYRGPNRLSRYEEVDSEPRVVNIPHGRPHFKNLEPLASKLPELKRNYYHYPEYVSRVEAAKSPDTNSVKYYEEAQENGFEVVGSSNLEASKEPSDISTSLDGKLLSSLSDADDSDSGSNWVDVEPLLSSVDKLTEVESHGDEKANEETAEQAPALETEKRQPLLTSKSLLVMDWDPRAFEQFFGSPESQTWANPPKIPNKALEESKKHWNRQQSSTISLHDCLKSFSVPEILGDQDLWYCPKCKDHRRATKTIQLWSTGDILTIHLKRFQSARRFSDKINAVVDFPIEGLDMSDYVNNPSKDGDLIYDLIAVDNHFGGLGGGHYTATALNFRDNKWYYFNDSRVTPVEDPKDCITSAAYLLFYKKRTSTNFAGGVNVQTLLERGRDAYNEKENQRHAQLLHISKQLSEYQRQATKGESNQEVMESEGTGETTSLGDEEEDLYENIPAAPTSTGTNKKSRSPISEQTMKFEFENQRKQRLISKTSDSQRAVNINLGYSSSASNLASPTGSSSSEEDAIFD